MKTIMVATDFSERSDRALRRATLLARQTDAQLLLVHVVDDDRAMRIVEAEREAALRLLAEQSETLLRLDSVACETRVVLASPFSGIVQASEEDAPDLLVLGPHRRQVLRDAFVGTTAERAIRSVACPVLMANAPPVGPYRGILLATDLSDASRKALEIYRSLGLGGHARLAALAVFDVPELDIAMDGLPDRSEGERSCLERERAEARGRLTAFFGDLGITPTEYVVRHDATGAAEEILSEARKEAAGLVVVGTRGRGSLAKFILGSVAEEVLRNATMDVLAIPPGPVGQDVD
ncbi:universal stress protein [Stappia indica]|uniref:universal stress protein n=1 Tax=Stappia indica TaxID=538381 RepID=UPI00082E9E3C|nr:universal stress protein [Stappia indica]